MTYFVITSSTAEEDLREAFLRYLERDEKLAVRFELEVVESINQIASNPIHSSIKYDMIRIKFLDSFPYGIHFRIKDSEILLVAVFHTSQSPRKWKKRGQ